jgi:hypothetical protein
VKTIIHHRSTGPSFICELRLPVDPPREAFPSFLK